MVVIADLLDGGGVAETGDVFVFLMFFPRAARATPGVVRACDHGKFHVGQHTLSAIDQRAYGACVYKQDFAAAVVQAPGALRRLVLGKEPEARGDLRSTEQLRWEGGHAADQIGPDHSGTDLVL